MQSVLNRQLFKCHALNIGLVKPPTEPYKREVRGAYISSLK